MPGTGSPSLSLAGTPKQPWVPPGIAQSPPSGPLKNPPGNPPKIHHDPKNPGGTQNPLGNPQKSIKTPKPPRIHKTPWEPLMKVYTQHRVPIAIIGIIQVSPNPSGTPKPCRDPQTLPGPPAPPGSTAGITGSGVALLRGVRVGPDQSGALKPQKSTMGRGQNIPYRGLEWGPHKNVT